MMVEPLLEKFVLMFDSFFHSEKSPSDLPFFKGQGFPAGTFSPL